MLMVGCRSWCTTGSILGPLLFNTLLCDMFLFCNDLDFASYGDDNTPYCIGKTPEEVISQLEKSSKSIFQWFENNVLKDSPGKCHLLFSKIDNFEANINENRTSNTRFEKLLGVTFNNQLNFKGQTKLCHDPPPSTTTHHQPKYIHHHPPPAKIYPPPRTTTHHQPRYIHQHPPLPTNS